MTVKLILLSISLSADAFAPPQLHQTTRIKSNQPIPHTLSALKDETTDVPATKDEVQDIQLPNIFTKHERPKDINTESFGPLLPIAKAVDDATGGWGLSYADLHPATPRTR